MRFLTFVAVASAAAALASPAFAEGVKVGRLQCDVSAGLGMIIASSKAMECRFLPLRGRSEMYHGFIRRFGLDLGGTDRGVLVWDVFAPGPGRVRHALAGDYSGIGAQATLGVGLGGSGLFDGNSHIGLEPVSLQSQNGLNIAAGVAAMELRPGA
jgi:hypothetical protein